MNVHTVGPGVVSALPCHSSLGWWAVVPDHSLVQEGCGVPVLRERVPTWAGTQVMSAHTPMWVCLPPQCGQQDGRWTCPVPRSHSPPPGTSLQPLCSKWSHVTSYDKWDERSSGISLFRVKAWTQGAVRLRQALSLPGHRRPLVQRLSSCQSLAGAS